LEFWRSYFGITEHDAARAARDKIAGRMVLLDETLAEGLPLMFDFLGVPDPERPAPPLGPEVREHQLFEVIHRLARARSAREPAVLLFEDLHWFDQASEEFVENVVVEITPGNRTLLVLNFRPEYHAAWMQRSYYQQLPLLPLGPEAIKELFADLLGYYNLGAANVLNHAWDDALEALEQALTIARDQRLLINQGRVLAEMAAAHLGLGERERALALADEAIEVCRRIGTRLWEFSAQLTRVRALRETRGLQAKKEIDAALGESDTWLEMSGAKSYEPFLHVERAELAKLTGDHATRARELREAHRLFLEIGAPIRAAEVAKELA
jgi:tetratricopeptide (TPR) repeat protein